MGDVLLIDGNSIGFAAHSSNKLHTGGQETQAIFGVIRTIRALLDEFRDSKPIVFWDGQSWRKTQDENYKANRDVDPKQSVERDAYKAQRPLIGRALAYLSVTQSSAANLEADDMIALYVENRVQRKAPGIATIVSGDRDLLQLVQPGVQWHNPVRLPGGRIPSMRHVTDASFTEHTGYETPWAFLQGKALIGDASDNLKGVTGIGEKAAPLILEHWKTVEAALADLRKNGDAAVPEHMSRYRKKLTDFATSPDEIRRFSHNVRMMGLKSAFLPKPERPTIVQRPLNEDGFLKLCEDLAFLSILRDGSGWLRPFRRVAMVGEAA